MQQDYSVPELTLVGDADRVILGSSGVGNDIAGEIQMPEMEFEED
jgi:hypothetical protein